MQDSEDKNQSINSKIELLRQKEKAMQCLEKGDLSQAERIYLNLLSSKYVDFELFGNLASICLMTGRRDEGIKFLRSALALNPNSPEGLSNLGIALQENGDLNAAIGLYKKALEINSQLPEALSNLGYALYQKGKVEEAIDCYRKAIAIRPQSPDTLYNLGNAFKAQGNTIQALEVYSKAIKIKPNFPDLLLNMGNAYKGIGDLDEAIDLYRKSIAVHHDFVEGYSNLGIALKIKGDFEAAYEALLKAYKLNPNSSEILSNLGLFLQEQGDINSAIHYFNLALDINDGSYMNLFNLGSAYSDLGDQELAISLYSRSLELNPDCVEALVNVGNIFNQLGEYDRSIEYFKKAILINSESHQAFLNLGLAYNATCQFDLAIESFNNALRIKQDYAEALSNKGISYQRIGDLGSAINSYRQAISSKPNFPEAIANYAISLREQGLLDQAILNYKKAICLKPDFTDALYNLGISFQECFKFESAIRSYKKALSLSQNLSKVKAALIHCEAYVCDWSEFDKRLSWLERLGIEGDPVSPWGLLSIEDSPEKHLIRARNHFDNEFVRQSEMIIAKRKSRIRVGFFSADFYNHATMHLAAPIFDLYDRSRFEMYIYSYGSFREDDVTKRLKDNASRFYDVRYLSDTEVVQLARQDQLDIAIDLKGYTKGTRLGMFSMRVAPVQISYLGYPGSMGTKSFDYIIADRVLIPKGHERFYSEKIIYMPYSYQCNDDKKIIANVRCLRAHWNLPEDAFVYCCFNASYKITPKEFNVWMRLLDRVENSVLWLLKTNPEVEKNLRKEAKFRGVDPSRLIFAERIKLEKHLARHQCADLFLDTFSCNAHTTASDCLWAGLPLLTFAGRSFSARVSASLLSALNLPELITSSIPQYEELAYTLATYPGQLIDLRARLASKLKSSELYNSVGFTRRLEIQLEKLIQ